MQTATPAPVSYANYLSSSPDRSSPVLLAGRTVSGNIYVFVSPESGITQARFFIDNTSATGTPFQTENMAPWDLAGGDSGANPYDTRTLSNGAHSITASITLTSGATTVTSASFTINNPLATPTPAPKPGPIYWGVNMSGLPEDIGKLSTWESNVAGKGASIAHWGQFWDSNDGGYKPWPSLYIDGVRNHGSIPMISWTPEGGTDPTRWQLRKIIDGVHDAYIRQFATDAKKWGFPFFLRIMHEMNGAWGWPWQEDSNGNKRGEFVPAWRHIIDIFRSVGVTNASFVWCPNVDWNGSPNPSYASLYPGDSYVDWICLDGYNWGTTRSWGWDTFDEVFNWSYNEIVKVAPSKPVMLGEFGSVEQGGSKAAWLTDALTVQIPSKYTKVRARSTSTGKWTMWTGESRQARPRLARGKPASAAATMRGIASDRSGGRSRCPETPIMPDVCCESACTQIPTRSLHMLSSKFCSDRRTRWLGLALGLILIAALALLSGVQLRGSVVVAAEPEAETWYTCSIANVATYIARIHVRCTAAAPGGILYFAYPTCDTANAARFLSLLSTAAVAGKQVQILYDPADTSGGAYGCSTGDCRALRAVALWP